MIESDYEQLIRDSLQRFRDLYANREEIDVELVKLRQFMYATLNMVSDTEREQLEQEINEAVRKASASATSLADSIRKVFQEQAYSGFTLGAIRNALMETGFDFSAYKSNPLSSISTTLRRMVETGELETHVDLEGTTIYTVRFRGGGKKKKKRK